MNLNTQPILAFPGLGFLEDAIGGAVGNVSNNIISTITGWILTSAFSIFGFAIDIAFSNDGIAADCPDAALGAELEACSNASFVTQTFQRSLTVAALLAVAALIWATMKAVITGDLGQFARKAFFDAPKIMIVSTFMVQITIFMLLLTDEISALLTQDALGPDRDQYLGSFDAQEIIDNPQILENTSFVVAILGVLLTIGSVALWALMMLRSVVIAALLVLSPLVAVSAIAGNGESWGKLLRLMFAVIASKLVVVIILSLGITTLLQIDFINAGLNPDAVIPTAPVAPGGEPVEDPGAIEAVAVGFENAYQLVTGALLVFTAVFSPVLIMQLLPDSVEQFYAFNNAHSISRRGRSNVIRGAKAIGTKR